MAVNKTNDYNIATNADLGNVLNNVDANRISRDLTYLELDGSTVKVSVGSLIESQGSLYKVDTAAETPTGTATAGAYLFFDDSTSSFVWSSTAGTYDPARGGIYDVSDRRQCRWILTSSTDWYNTDFQNQALTYYRYSYFGDSTLFSYQTATQIITDIDAAYGDTVPRGVVIKCMGVLWYDIG